MVCTDMRVHAPSEALPMQDHIASAPRPRPGPSRASGVEAFSPVELDATEKVRFNARARAMAVGMDF